MLAGVGAGLAAYLGIDVTVVRILIVVLTLVTNGLGLVAYLAAAILLPADDGTGAGAARSSGNAAPSTDGTSAVGARDPLFWVGIGLLVLGALLLLNGPLAAGRWLPIRFGPEVLLPLVLIGFGLALWRAGDRRHVPPSVAPPGAVPPVWSPTGAGGGPGTGPTTSPFAPATPASTSTTPASPMETPMSTAPRAPGGTSAPPAPDGPAASPAGSPAASATDDATPPPAGRPAAWQQPPAASGGAVPPVWSPPPVGGNRPPLDGGGGTAWTPPPAPERPSSLLGRLVFGLALVTVGALWIVDISTRLSLGTGRILAAGLLVLGLGLLAGAFVGRARWLILPAALLTPVVLLASILSPMSWAGVDVRTDGVGERVERPASVTEAEAGYQLGAGSLRLDLTGLELADLEAAGTTAIAVQVGAGEVVIDAPDDVNVTVTARAGAGEVALFGTEGTGLGVTRSDAYATLDEGAPAIELDVQVGFGTVTVRALTADRLTEGIERRPADDDVDDVTGEDPLDDTTDVTVDDPLDDPLDDPADVTGDGPSDDTTDVPGETDADGVEEEAAGLRLERIAVGA